MDRRAATRTVARDLCSVIKEAGSTPEGVAEATDVPLSSLLAERELTLDELVRVGGFLHVHPARLVAA
jgi:hypothetical protein